MVPANPLGNANVICYRRILFPTIDKRNRLQFRKWTKFRARGDSIIAGRLVLTRWSGGGSGGARSGTNGGAADGGDFPSFRGFCSRPSRHFRYFIILHLFDHGDRRRANRRLGRRRDSRRRGPRVMMMFPSRVIIFLGLD